MRKPLSPVVKMASVLAALSSCLLPVTVQAADAPQKLTTAVDQAVRPLLKQYDVPGIVLGVTVNGRQHFFAYGVASKEKQTPPTKDTLFEIGSVSKTFAATMASYALTLGKLSLEDHPSKYMPALQGKPIDKATVLNFGTYTAGGLPLQFPGPVKNDRDMIAYFQQWQPSAAPGTQRRYSNPSLGLFGHLAALAMKRDYAQIMETDVFPKLGLNHTYVRVPQAAMADYAWGYNKANKPIRANPGVFDSETYGVRISAADLIRFVEANIRPDTLEPSMRRAVEGTHIGYFKTGDMVQGLGWEQYAYPVTLDRLLAGNSEAMIRQPNATTQFGAPQTPSGPTLFNKTGSTNGFGAYALFVPAKKIGLVMLANKNFPIPARVTAAYAVLEALDAAAQ